MVSYRQVCAGINGIEADLSWCLNAVSLDPTQEAEARSGEDFLAVQSKLIDSIQTMDDLYRKVKKERKKLIEVKERLSRPWFEDRQRRLARYEKGILNAVAIARTIGDAFAWIFYRNERKLLHEHLKCQYNALMPPGVGGKGERAFARDVRGVSGHMVLYHGITSILRLGDFSLVDLSAHKIAGIGEIKTKSADQLGTELVATIISDDHLNLKVADQESERNDRAGIDLSQQAEFRLKRQVSEIAKTLSAVRSAQSDGEISVVKPNHIDALAEVALSTSVGCFGFVKAGSGMVVNGYRTARRSLGSHILDNAKIDLEADKGRLSEGVASIMEPDSSANQLFIQSFLFSSNDRPNFSPSSIPFLWWSLPHSVKKDILFGRLIVTTLFNPVHFYSALERREFEVSSVEGTKIRSVTKATDGRSLTVEGIAYFLDLIQSHFLDETTVVDMIEQAINQSELLGPNKAAKINMSIFLEV